MGETYAEMKARIQPERYEVVRHESGVAKMSRGLSGTPTFAQWEEPAVWATIRERATGRTVVSSVYLNSLSLAIPEGPSGRFPRGVAASDEEIILATVGDEPIFDHYGGKP